MSERGLFELFTSDPERADALLWGRRSSWQTRRGFLKGAGLTAVSAALGAALPFSEWVPAGWLPLALAQGKSDFPIPGKQGLEVLNDRPLTAETPMHLLDDEITPAMRLFVRNNGLVPPSAEANDSKDWQLEIDGEVEKPLRLSLADLKQNFKSHTYQLTLECGGNGRAGFSPPTIGTQWTYGGVGCPSWTGVRLADVLQAAGLKKSAFYTGYYGADIHPSGDPKKVVISRGTPMAKALEPTTLIAYAMNGAPLPALHGFPARIVCAGYPGSVSCKWLRRVWVRDRVHDGEKMEGSSYRVPRYPIAPGASVDEKSMVIIEKMPVKSLITFPQSGLSHPLQKGALRCRGFAWTGEKLVKAVNVSFDFGQTWISTHLQKPRNPFAWQRWEVELKFPTKGYYEIWARATDDTGRRQPMVIPGWNPKGYLNNAMPRIAVKVV